jgi:hypothetical protein
MKMGSKPLAGGPWQEFTSVFDGDEIRGQPFSLQCKELARHLKVAVYSA